MILRTQEGNRPLGRNRSRAKSGISDRNQFEAVDVLSVILDKASRIDACQLIFERKPINIIRRIEPSKADQRVDPVAIPHLTVGENDLLDAGCGSKEMASHGQRVDQEAGVALQFDEQVVAAAQQGNVLGSNAGANHHQVNVAPQPLVADRVRAAAVAEDIAIRARAAGERVIAKATIERLVRRRTTEVVGMDRAHQTLDVPQGVAQSLTRQPLAEGQIDADRFIGRAVVGRVKSAAAIKQVSAPAAAQPIVAAIPQKAVVVIAALDDFDVAEAIPRRLATGCRAVGQIHHHAFRRKAEIHGVQPLATADRVGAATAAEAVIARAAEELVVAAPALDAVGAVISGENIREVGADKIFDRHKKITFGISAAGRAV